MLAHDGFYRSFAYKFATYNQTKTEQQLLDNSIYNI